MKTNLTKIAFYGFIAVTLIGTAVSFFKGCKSSSIVKTTQRAADVFYDSVKHYRDLWNTEHAQHEQMIADKLNADIFYREQVDSICKRLRIKEKQLTSMTNMHAQASGVVSTSVQFVTVHDTVPGLPVGWTGQHFAWRDSFLQMDGYVDSSKATVFYSMDLPIKVNTFWRRRWFLGRKRSIIDAHSENPNVHITLLTGVKIN